VKDRDGTDRCTDAMCFPDHGGRVGYGDMVVMPFSAGGGKWAVVVVVSVVIVLIR
jgi:hypothetical protein